MLKINDYKKLSKDKKVVFNWICAGLMLILLIMQFMPYWNFTVEIPRYRQEVDMSQFEVVEETTDTEATEATEATATETEDVEVAEDQEAVADEENLPYFECPECSVLLRKDDPTIPVTMKDVLDSTKVEDRKVSINDYVWMPFNHKTCDAKGLSDPELEKAGMSGLENYLNGELKGEPVKIENILRMPIAYMIISVLALLIALSNPKKLAIPVFAVIGGAVALAGYIMEPVFALSSSWMIHVIVSALITVAGIGTIIFRIIKREPKDA